MAPQSVRVSIGIILMMLGAPSAGRCGGYPMRGSGWTPGRYVPATGMPAANKPVYKPVYYQPASYSWQPRYPQRPAGSRPVRWWNTGATVAPAEPGPTPTASDRPEASARPYPFGAPPTDDGVPGATAGSRRGVSRSSPSESDLQRSRLPASGGPETDLDARPVPSPIYGRYPSVDALSPRLRFYSTLFPELNLGRLIPESTLDSMRHDLVQIDPRTARAKLTGVQTWFRVQNEQLDRAVYDRLVRHLFSVAVGTDLENRPAKAIQEADFLIREFVDLHTRMGRTPPLGLDPDVVHDLYVEPRVTSETGRVRLLDRLLKELLPLLSRPSPVPVAKGPVAKPAPVQSSTGGVGAAGWPIALVPLALLAIAALPRRRQPADVAPEVRRPDGAPSNSGIETVPGGSRPSLPRPPVPPRNEPVLPEFGSRYVDVAYVARGGMGIVYRARDRELGRTVAIKMLPPEFHQEAIYVGRFFRECRAMARLSHPAIVAVHDVVSSPFPYFVMEYLEGRSLRSHLAEGNRIAAERALTIALDLAQALDYAHRSGVVHRDIKPENIMLTTGGRTKLLDLGLARIATEERMTQPNVLMGTPSYIAPELYRGAVADGRSDIFALGVVFLELFSGERRPQLLPGGPLVDYGPQVEPLRSSFPGPLVDAIGRMLAPEPAARLSDLSEILNLLSLEIDRGHRPAVRPELAAFRSVLSLLDDAYTRSMHGLKATLGVYRRCEREPEKIFQYLLNRDAVAEVSARIRTLIDGPVAGLQAGRPSGDPALDALVAAVTSHDWSGLQGTLADLASDSTWSRSRARGAWDQLKALHVSFAALCDRVARFVDGHRVRVAPVVARTLDARGDFARIETDLGDASVTVPDPEQFAKDLVIILENLINNALEAQARRVVVRVVADGSVSRLAVSDDGVGIAADRLPRIFDSGVSTKTTGSGTGLSRVKSLAASYQGRVQADSVPGQGSEFSVWFEN